MRIEQINTLSMVFKVVMADLSSTGFIELALSTSKSESNTLPLQKNLGGGFLKDSL